MELLTAAGWDHDDVDDAVLLASELVTNAVRHADGVDRITMVVDHRTLLFVVHDRSVTLPSAPSERPGEHGGRGLAIVEALSDEWGAAQEHDGKRVWFRLTR